MDASVVFREIGSFFIKMCNIHLTFAGIDFTVGAMYMWMGIACIIIYILKGLSS